MKKLIVVLLSVIFTTLIIGHIQLIFADHLEPGLGIFKNEKEINTISTEDSKYQIYLTVVIRNAQGELISITEAIRGIHIAHEITDYAFDEMLGKKEIVTINKMKYEKVQFIETNDVNTYTGFFNSVSTDMHSLWKLEFCLQTNEHGNEQGISCIPIFQTTTPHVPLDEDNIFRQTWTILREL